MKSNKEVIQKFLSNVNHRNYDALENILAPNFQRHCQATPQVEIKNKEAFIEFIKLDHQSFPDGVMKPKMMIAEENTVAGMYTYSGTQEGTLGELPALGNSFTLNFLMFNTIENGKIMDMHVEWDNISLLGQLGHM
ncbi:ester cyclase [Endozoicomonas arenosclerae]|uniref:ester cyclase n=1 Tax=Endozoicomonas arenosclerae TaxID=1633495 RepID=UPI000784904C|nr:ester cyclase [Endozoicomonas arenosclerae]